ncbi:hypothetical protein EDC96DRAFT_562444 [Choanephora cucurbitarum]|nr:hypothetical protein EDC96DRAFT_562444 [Choanephora cucurbitarum]
MIRQKLVHHYLKISLAVLVQDELVVVQLKKKYDDMLLVHHLMYIHQAECYDAQDYVGSRYQWFANVEVNDKAEKYCPIDMKTALLFFVTQDVDTIIETRKVPFVITKTKWFKQEQTIIFLFFESVTGILPYLLFIAAELLIVVS